MSQNYKLQVAVIGGGPSGFYAAEALVNAGINAKVTIIEKLPCPYGLIRYGVAPDHQKLKSVTNTLDEIAQHPLITFLGNVEIGKNLSLATIRCLYHAVIFTTGMPNSNQLGIPGENLVGVHPSSDFIGWYNGHPDYQEYIFDFNHEEAVIIGHGNVAIDICRVLTKSIDELRKSDITEAALEALHSSKISEVHLVGRRGPVQAKFTPKELHELAKLQDSKVFVDPKSLDVGMACQIELEDINSAMNKKNYDILQKISGFYTSDQVPMKKHIFIDFLLSPVEFRGDQHLRSVWFDKVNLQGQAFNQRTVSSGSSVEISAGLAFSCVGFKGTEIAGLQINKTKGTLLHENSRLIDATNSIIKGMYTAGWVKRGPQGVIGTNRECAQSTVDEILIDLPDLTNRQVRGQEALISYLTEQNIQFVTFDAWKIIDAAEIERGRKLDKPREKFTSVASMLACL